MVKITPKDSTRHIISSNSNTTTKTPPTETMAGITRDTSNRVTGTLIRENHHSNREKILNRKSPKDTVLNVAIIPVLWPLVGLKFLTLTDIGLLF